MMQLLSSWVFFVAAAILLAPLTSARAQGTAFTYQGVLTENGAPASGIYAFRFVLFDQSSGGNMVSPTLTQTAGVGDGGRFVTTIEFGSDVFSGGPRFLDIAVRTNGSADEFVSLTPRQQITATPMATVARSIRGTTTPEDSAHSAIVNVVNGSPANYIGPGVYGGTIAGGGGSNYFGYWVPNAVTADYGTVSGGEHNTASGVGSSVGGGRANTAGKDNATIAGGMFNSAMGTNATISGGYGNNAGGDYATVPGGLQNNANGDYSFAGGYGAGALHEGAFVWAGSSAINSSAPGQFLVTAFGGVGINTRNPGGTLHVHSDIDSHRGERVRLSGRSFLNNSGTTNGVSLLVGYNEPNNRQFWIADSARLFRSATNMAVRLYPWNGGNVGVFDCITMDGAQSRNLAIQAEGGNVGIGTFSPATALEVRTWSSSGNVLRFGYAGGGAGNLIAGPSYVGIATDDLITRLCIRQGGGNIGIGTLNPGYTLEVNGSAGKPGGGSWSNTSDQRLKKNIEPLHGALDKIMQLRGVSYEWINPAEHAGQAGTQAGFVAQEVERVFPAWVSQTTVAGQDAALTPDGRARSLSLPFEFDALMVEALRELRAEKDAAIEQVQLKLAKELERRDAQNAQLRRELEELRALIGSMDVRVLKAKNVRNWNEY